MCLFGFDVTLVLFQLLYMKIALDADMVFIEIYFWSFPLCCMEQCDRKQCGREQEKGRTGKYHKPGLKLRSPEAQHVSEDFFSFY